MISVQFAACVWLDIVFTKWLIYDLDDAFYTHIITHIHTFNSCVMQLVLLPDRGLYKLLHVSNGLAYMHFVGLISR